MAEQKKKTAAEDGGEKMAAEKKTVKTKTSKPRKKAESTSTKAAKEQQHILDEAEETALDQLILSGRNKDNVLEQSDISDAFKGMKLTESSRGTSSLP